MVTIRGTVFERITGPIAENHIDKLAKKYIDKQTYPNRAPGEHRGLLIFKPEKVFYVNQ